jgi:hypothetical protein
MGGGASAARDLEGGGGKTWKQAQIYDGAARLGGWREYSITVEEDGIVVLDRPVTGDPLLKIAFDKDLRTSIDRTDESHKPILVIRQDTHTLCIKFENEESLATFTSQVNSNVLMAAEKRDETASRGLSRLFEIFDKVMDDSPETFDDSQRLASEESGSATKPPAMNIAILVVGTRGDVQPVLSPAAFP